MNSYRPADPSGQAITINDMTPGPMVEADLGDLIRIEADVVMGIV